MNLEFINDEVTTSPNTNQCLSKLSDVEFDKSINEFMNRLLRIETEKSQVKLMPNIQEDWVSAIRTHLQTKPRAATVPADAPK